MGTIDRKYFHFSLTSRVLGGGGCWSLLVSPCQICGERSGTATGFFSRALRCLSVIVIPQMSRNLSKSSAVSKVEGHWMEKYFHYLVFKGMVRRLVFIIQGYSKWLSGYNCPAAIPQQIRETTTIWQFHPRVVCTVSRDRVRVYPGTEGTNQNRHWNHHRWHAERTRLSCWCL